MCLNCCKLLLFGWFTERKDFYSIFYSEIALKTINLGCGKIFLKKANVKFTPSTTFEESTFMKINSREILSKAQFAEMNSPEMSEKN